MLEEWRTGGLEDRRTGRLEKSGQPSNLPCFQPSNLPLFYLLFIIAFAFGLRLVKLNDLPLSLSLDEAVDGLDALQLFRLRWITPFLQNYFGRETLFFYLQGLVLWLGGISIFSLRFASVLAGTLTIPLLYVVGQRLGLAKAVFFDRRPTTADRQLFSDDNLQATTLRAEPAPPRWGSSDEACNLQHLNLISLLAATGLAVSYWHIYFSRVSFRGILLPPLLLGLIWCFWRGWSSPLPHRGGVRGGWLIAAGFLLGLTFYTYLAARLLPILFIVFIVIELLRRKSDRPEKLLGFLIFGGVAVITALPLILYFQQNPQALSSRAQAISIFASNAPLETLVNNFLVLLRIHFLGNSWLGQWPALDWVSALGLLLGLLICLYHFKKPACLFLLLWWIIGTTPVLSSEQDWEATTTLLRGTMAWPALYLISAIGLAALSQRISESASQRIKIRHSPLALLPCGFASPPLRLLAPLSMLLMFGALTNIYNYFFVWATSYNNFSDHPPAMARYLNSQTEQLTLTPLKFYGETVVNFLLQARYPNLVNVDSETLWSLLESNPTTVYVLPDEATDESVFVLLTPAANGQGTAYLLPPLTPPQIEALADHTRKLVPLTTVLDREQEPIAQVYPLSADAPFLSSREEETPWQPGQTSFKNDVLLTGYHVEPVIIKPAETVTLFLNWQAQQPIDGDYYLFIHLFDVAQGQRWEQVNAPLTGVLFNAHRWPVGLTVPDIHHFTLPTNAPDGAYRFEVGLYSASSQQRLPVTAGPVDLPADKLILGKFYVWRQPPSPPQYPLADVQFGDSIALIGLDLPASTLHPGQTLSYNLYWQALATIPQSYTVFTHLVDAVGNLKAQQDNVPQQGHYPTLWWDPGETIIDSYNLPLPPDLAPGQYTLRVGLYEPQTGRRLPLQNEGQDFVDLPNYIKLQN